MEQHEVVQVHARPWAHGWELYVFGQEDLVTQCEALEDASQVLRDYLETIFPGADFDQVGFEVIRRP